MNKKETKLIFTKSAIAKSAKYIDDIIVKADIKDGDKVAIAFWVSPIVYYRIKKKYPNCDVYYIDTINLSREADSSHVIILGANESWGDMKFDRIIMNPPYDGNLHLKFLKEALNHLTEDGKVVNISPVRWLQDPSSRLRKSQIMRCLKTQ